MDVLARSMLCCGAIFPRHRKATPSLIRDDDYSDWGGRDGRDRITGVFSMQWACVRVTLIE